MARLKQACEYAVPCSAPCAPFCPSLGLQLLCGFTLFLCGEWLGSRTCPLFLSPALAGAFSLPEENVGVDLLYHTCCGHHFPNTPALQQVRGSLAPRRDPQRVSSAAHFILPVVGGWLYPPLEHRQDPDLCQDAVHLPVTPKAWPNLCLVVQVKSTVLMRLMLMPSCRPVACLRTEARERSSSWSPGCWSQECQSLGVSWLPP